MTIESSNGDWSQTAKIFHWIVVVGVVVMISLGVWAEETPVSPLKFKLFGYHKATGILVLLTMIARLGWRLRNPRPPLPDHMPPWEKRAAEITHWLLYGLLIAIPISGWVMSSAANFPVSMYGLFSLPDLVGPSKALSKAAAQTHHLLLYLVMATLAAHIGAALRHHFMTKDDVLNGMLPKVLQRKSGEAAE